MPHLTTRPRPHHRPRGPLALGLLLLGGALASAGARAEPPSTLHARQAELELVETAPGKPTVATRFVVGLVDLAPSQVSAQVGDVLHRLSLRLDARSGTLSCDLERRELEGRRTHEVKLKASARVAVGQRILLGRVQRPDGSRFEAAVTLR